MCVKIFEYVAFQMSYENKKAQLFIVITNKFNSLSVAKRKHDILRFGEG